jgi:hypothetical protein
MRIIRLLSATSLLTAVASLYSIGTLHAQATPTPTPSFKFLGFQKLVAIGNALETTTEGSSCTGVICPDPGSCDDYSFSGQIASFDSFGPGMVNPTVQICVSDDKVYSVPNGNFGTACTPVNGTVTISGSPPKTVSMSLSGQLCTLAVTPPSTDITVVDAAFAITASGPTTVKVARGSGTFSASFSSVNGSTSGNDSTFTFDGNFSK